MNIPRNREFPEFPHGSLLWAEKTIHWIHSIRIVPGEANGGIWLFIVATNFWILFHDLDFVKRLVSVIFVLNS